jgi:spore coat polysaccharide biosynthesis protein SpsF
MGFMKPFNLAILQARMSSTRLPGKVMRNINGKPMIYWQIERIKKSKSINKLIVATSIDESDDILTDFLESNKVEVYRGELQDVLSRFLEIEEHLKPKVIIRLTGDCPLVMPKLIDEMIAKFDKINVDYLSNTLELTYPDGLDIEIVKSGVLKNLSNCELSNLEREHVTLGIVNRKNLFSTECYFNYRDLSHYRWTVDTFEDFEFVSMVFKKFRLKEVDFTFEELEKFFEENPEINQIRHRD